MLGKTEDEVRSPKKIINLVSISKDVIFEDTIPNNLYKVIRLDNTPFDFTISDFPLMNLNDLITLAKIVGDINDDQLEYKAREMQKGLLHW